MRLFGQQVFVPCSRKNIDTEKDSSGRVILNMYHQLPAFNDVYIVGDCAALPYAPSAQVAEEQAEQIVKVLRHVWSEEAFQKRCRKLS